MVQRVELGSRVQVEERYLPLGRYIYTTCKVSQRIKKSGSRARLRVRGMKHRREEKTKVGVDCIRNTDGTYKMIVENPGICRFIWEHLNNVNHIVQCMKYSGGTFSGFKVVLCTTDFSVVGHRCTPCGCIPDELHVTKVTNWGPCCDVSDVHAFLGTVSVLHIFIKNFAHRAHTLTMLTCKLQPF